MREKEKAEELKAKILALIPGQQIKIKSGSGNIEGTLKSVNEPSKIVQVEFSDGLPVMIAWSKVDFRIVPPKMIENEYGKFYPKRLGDDDDDDGLIFQLEYIRIREGQMVYLSQLSNLLCLRLREENTRKDL